MGKQIMDLHACQEKTGQRLVDYQQATGQQIMDLHTCQEKTVRMLNDYQQQTCQQLVELHTQVVNDMSAICTLLKQLIENKIIKEEDSSEKTPTKLITFVNKQK